MSACLDEKLYGTQLLTRNVKNCTYCCSNRCKCQICLSWIRGIGFSPWLHYTKDVKNCTQKLELGSHLLSYVRASRAWVYKK